MFKTIAFRHWIAAASAAGVLALPTAHAQVCPFDNGGSTLENDGLVLTRYALGLRGAPMLANTSFAAGDAATIESSIACPSCGLRVTDDKDALNNPIFTVADATIISRKIAGFSGPALTNGITAFGSGTRNSAAAVQSFLLAGCGATGGTVTSVRGGAGIVATGPNVVGGAIISSGLIELANGYILPQGCAAGQVPKSAGGGAWSCAADNVGGGVTNAFVNGGNAFGVGVEAVLGTTDGRPLTVGTGLGDGLRISRYSFVEPQYARTVNVINGSRENSIGPGVSAATIAGGGYVRNPGTSLESPRPNRVLESGGTVGGGGANTASGFEATVSGGSFNTASGESSTVPGGFSNKAQGAASFAAGYLATASGVGEFVWNSSDETIFNPASLGYWGGNTNYTVNMRALRGFSFTAGGGTQCSLGQGTTGWTCASDRSLKDKIMTVNPRAVLEKVANLPISTWVMKGFDQLHMGPMAQDFRSAFGLGSGDKSINTTDAQGVALAAIQGLNQKLNEQGKQIKAKDDAIARLTARLATIEKRLGFK